MIRQHDTKLAKKENQHGYSYALLCDASASIILNTIERTPMSTLKPTSLTPITASLSNCHAHAWHRYPVAIAGQVSRSLSFGTGFFKLQLQYVVSLLLSPLLVSRWSCNLKKLILGTVNLLVPYRTPMTMLLSPLHQQHRNIAAHRCFLPSSSKCWNKYADPTL